MKPFQFITLRYRHDAVTGEFANVGLVIYAPGEFLRARFNLRIGRLKALFGDVDTSHVKSLLGYLDGHFTKLSTEMPNSHFRAGTSLEDLVRSVLPQDDSALQWSPSNQGLTRDPEMELEHLYARLVTHYEPKRARSHRNDQDVWRAFSVSLKQRAVLDKLEPKRLVAPDFDYTFEHAWKNGAWNLYEPVAFDYEDADRILDKGNRWLGRGVALKEANEPHKFWFLVGEPAMDRYKGAAEKAINLLCKIQPGQVEIVREHEREEFSAGLADEMKHHESA